MAHARSTGDSIRGRRARNILTPFVIQQDQHEQFPSMSISADPDLGEGCGIGDRIAPGEQRQYSSSCALIAFCGAGGARGL